MRSQLVEPTDAASFGATLDAFCASAGDPALVFAAVGAAAPLGVTELAELAQRTRVPLVGARFPRVVHGVTSSDQAIVLLAWSGGADVAVVPDLAEPARSLTAKLEAAVASWPATAHGTESVLVAVDGFSSHISELLFEVYAAFGDRFTYFGGGAGVVPPDGLPVVFTADGVWSDAALLVRLDERPSIGVSHGLERLRGPLIATAVDGRTVRELNWEPALDVYRRCVAQAGRQVDTDDFYATAKDFPLGIERTTGEVIVRDPIAVTPEGGLACVGDIPENAALYVLRVVAEDLVAAARAATVAALAAHPPSRGRGRSVFLADCISRAMFLEDRLGEELGAIQQAAGPDTVIAGALTVGEIASAAGTFLEFYNKTTVVAAFPQKP